MRALRGAIVLIAFCASPAVHAQPLSRPAPRGQAGKQQGKPLPLYSRAIQGRAHAPAARGAARKRASDSFGWRRHPIFGDIRRHNGIDFPKPHGTRVYPAQKGIVNFAGWKRGYGWVVELRHSNGARTIYGHLARIFVVPGQSVSRGMLLGAVGSSGYATGPHLHFEYRNAAGQALDPRGLMAAL
mgnify:FL=1